MMYENNRDIPTIIYILCQQCKQCPSVHIYNYVLYVGLCDDEKSGHNNTAIITNAIYAYKINQNTTI